jgi:hypothetical protein
VLALIVLGLWLLTALACSAAGLLRELPGPGVQAVIVAVTVVMLLAVRRMPPLRRDVERVPSGVLVGVHLTRFMGLLFLTMANSGRLPGEWALPAGLGDTLVASLAVVVLATGAVRSRRWLAAWNVLGLVDIVFVVGSAVRMNLLHPGSLHELASLPLALLPTFLVPLIIVTHVIMLARCHRGRF